MEMSGRLSSFDNGSSKKDHKFSRETESRLFPVYTLLTNKFPISFLENVKDIFRIYLRSTLQENDSFAQRKAGYPAYYWLKFHVKYSNYIVLKNFLKGE
ncbi:hypothetical protein AVEN_1504-1 [Araneus ventricosus]|uniref:Uncharacterized protein n=1 Tax=Araneus ventricosus TaxID=182803 RepID=A0A4Y2GE85_ARAVE|nr:hypothetical protein AVEN_1504-1 [Araneus ventricosus]